MQKLDNSYFMMCTRHKMRLELLFSKTIKELNLDSRTFNKLVQQNVIWIKDIDLVSLASINGIGSKSIEKLSKQLRLYYWQDELLEYSETRLLLLCLTNKKMKMAFLLVNRLTINELDLSLRSFKILSRLKIDTVSEIDEKVLSKYPGIGKGIIADIHQCIYNKFQELFSKM